MERYAKGTFAPPQQRESRRNKAQSNNPTGNGHSIKVNQSGIMIGLPKVSKHGNNDDRAEFSPSGGKGSGY